MSTDHLFQLALLGANVISGLAWFAIRREIAHVREIVQLRLDNVEKRIEKLEDKTA
jgi:hypothetical protein